jgi:hypothetical protein
LFNRARSEVLIYLDFVTNDLAQAVTRRDQPSGGAADRDCGTLE